MKKMIMINLLCWMGMTGVVEAQTVRYFQFQFKNGHYLTAKEGRLTASEELGSQRGASQWFEVTMEDDFSFRLAPLDEPGQYLTNKDGKLSLKGTTKDEIQWKVVYAGAGYVSIMGNDEQMVLADLDGHVSLTPIPGKLKNSDDATGDHYRLKVISGEPAVVREATKAVQAREEKRGGDPLALKVESYPNPVIDRATITYQLETATKVYIAVLDLQGRLVNVLVDDQLEGGRYETLWEKNNLKGFNVSAGLYVLSAQMGEETYRQLLIVE